MKEYGITKIAVETNLNPALPSECPRVEIRSTFLPITRRRKGKSEFGPAFYTRIDAAATPEQKTKLKKLSPDAVKESTLAGEPITGKLTRAPGNNAPIGGLKVTTVSGWFAARPSGTENIYKIYAESAKSEEHLSKILAEAEEIVSNAMGDGRA